MLRGFLSFISFGDLCQSAYILSKFCLFVLDLLLVLHIVSFCSVILYRLCFDNFYLLYSIALTIATSYMMMCCFLESVLLTDSLKKLCLLFLYILFVL